MASLPIMAARLSFILSRFPDMARLTVPTLLSRLRSRDSDTVDKASDALRERAESDPPAFQTSEVVTALMQLLSDEKNWNRRTAALHALDRCCPEEAVRRILAGLRHPDRKRRTVAAGRLGTIKNYGSENLEKVIRRTGRDALLAAARDPDSTVVSSTAIGMLARLRFVEAVPLMIEMLNDEENPFAQGDALIALQDMGRAASPALPRMIELLESSNGNYAAQAIGVLGALGADAIPHLERVRRDAKENGDDELEEACGEALRKLKRAAKK
jgi:HEAT repeat protein